MRFQVPGIAPHEVDFTVGRLWRGVQLRLDGTPVEHQMTLSNYGRTRTYSFEVDGREVRVEKTSRRFFAGLRHQPLAAYVDGEKVAEG